MTTGQPKPFLPANHRQKETKRFIRARSRKFSISMPALSRFCLSCPCRHSNAKPEMKKSPSLPSGDSYRPAGDPGCFIWLGIALTVLACAIYHQFTK